VPDQPARPHGSNGFLIAATIVGGFAISFALMFRGALTPAASQQLGQSFPAIEAVGWINGPIPTVQSLRGQVYVVDAWAYWCTPCRIAIPELVQLHEKYKDRGVRFLGLTTEGGDPESLQLTRECVESLQIPWANGYAAIKTLTDLSADSIPQLWVVDRQNRIVFHHIGWDSNSSHEIEQAILAALGDSADVAKSPGTSPVR
jgi:thiol-disulfide isomerase/thioredoxin